MGDRSNIDWCDATWNPVTGCSHVSPGCERCYAEALSLRRGWSKHPWGAQYAAENVVLHPDRLDQPLHWKKPRRVFVNSMSDLFHEQVPWDFIAKVFAIMQRCPRHTFQILTKRPERMQAFVSDVDERAGHLIRADGNNWPLPNVWLGVSVEDQRRADERIPLLLQTPAAVQFVSYEPALGPVDFSKYLRCCPSCGQPRPDRYADSCAYCEGGHFGIDWLICGGESGPNHRPFDLDWARSARDQCQAAGVKFFFKQVGGITPKAGGRLLDGCEWNEYPEAAT
ncbi:MAG: phage Gp37/Gp68 family protein [Patescibacteria group bacterium]|nr:phage Gp37/Gp68 family protein [Patescibacteria group bacterium]